MSCVTFLDILPVSKSPPAVKLPIAEAEVDAKPDLLSSAPVGATSLTAPGFVGRHWSTQETSLKVTSSI